MSKIVSCKALIPDADAPIEKYASSVYDNKIELEKTKALPIVEREVILPDPRTYRSMSRAAILLSIVCLETEKDVKVFLEKSPFSVGVYCAIENGPVNFASAKRMVGASKDSFGQLYKKYHNPKMYLKQLPNLPAAQMGIFMGILGLMNIYNHSTLGSLQALEQAEMDLMDDRIDAALVCSAFSFENPMIMERLKRTCLKDSILCEGAAAMLLVRNGNVTDWKNQNYTDTDEYYGISHQIVIQILNWRENHGW